MAKCRPRGIVAIIQKLEDNAMTTTEKWEMAIDGLPNQLMKEKFRVILVAVLKEIGRAHV